MKNLHVKYKSEGGKDSYTTFTRNRPFYVVNPTLNDRETCACVKHSNLILKAEKLKALKIIPSCKVSDLATVVSSNPESKECMYNTCPSCTSKSIPVSEDQRNQVNLAKKISRTRVFNNILKYLPVSAQVLIKMQLNIKKAVEEDLTMMRS